MGVRFSKYLVVLLLIGGLLAVPGCQRKTRTSTANKNQTANAANENTQATIEDHRKVFDVELHQPARQLLADVEKRFGTRVREIVTDDLAFEAYYAQASISADGTPNIQIRREITPTEELIVHELSHLQLGAKGFPAIRMEFPANLSAAKKDNIRFLAAMIFDTIEHYIFYPAMRDMGFVPDETLRAYMRNVMREGDYEETDGVSRKDMRTLGFFKAAVLLNDPEMLTLRIADWYEEKGWQDSLQTARAMIVIINEIKPSTPDQAVSALIRCLNVIQENVNTFDVAQWETVNHGIYNLRRAYISATPQQKRPEQQQAKIVPDTTDVKDTSRNSRAKKAKRKETAPPDFRVGTIIDQIRKSIPSL